jgi:predicted O-methyltransferase YrrM
VGVGFLSVILAVMVALIQRVRSEIESRYRRTEAILALYSVIEPQKPLPMPRVYMASAELLRAVADATFQLKPEMVVELGSGISTLVTAYALAKIGSGRIVSLDHEAQFAEHTNRLLRSHQLDHIAKAVHAPLVETEAGGQRFRWYDTKALAGVGAIDLLIVDGPPGKDEPLARYPALPVLADRLSERAWVLVDDAARKDETEMVARWVAMFPRFDAEYVPTEKGLGYLRPKAV